MMTNDLNQEEKNVLSGLPFEKKGMVLKKFLRLRGNYIERKSWRKRKVTDTNVAETIVVTIT